MHAFETKIENVWKILYNDITSTTFVYLFICTFASREKFIAGFVIAREIKTSLKVCTLGIPHICVHTYVNLLMQEYLSK